jgi:hypothetical protein
MAATIQRREIRRRPIHGFLFNFGYTGYVLDPILDCGWGLLFVLRSGSSPEGQSASAEGGVLERRGHRGVSSCRNFGLLKIWLISCVVL